jgi:uncharacterized membrane protein YedE/YeeE
MAFLPWWAGALALGGIALAFFWITGRTMGVSGSLARALDFTETRAVDRAEAAFADGAALDAALAAATRAEFGDAAADASAGSPATTTPAAAPPALPRRLPWSAHVTFLAAIVVGALSASWWRGGLALHRDLGAEFSRLVASGWRAWPVLVGGGVLVGFGTRMAGGCTSGHGLSGCGRLQPGSLVATAIFFGCAVAISLLLGALA